ncbi:MAG: hypothetical protein RL653_1006 [Pseudomonadota bacterium]|jgi:hypothetical protein
MATDSSSTASRIQRLFKSKVAAEREAATNEMLEGDLALYDEVFEGVEIKVHSLGNRGLLSAQMKVPFLDGLLHGRTDSASVEVALYAGPTRQRAEWQARHGLDTVQEFMVGTHGTKPKSYSTDQVRLITQALPKLEQVVYQNTSTDSLGELPPNLKGLEFCLVKRVNWKQVFAFKELEHLLVSNCPKLDPKLRGFEALTQLRSLWIHDRVAGQENGPLESVEGIRSLSRLTSLKLGSACDVSAIAGLESLSHLHLGGSKKDWAVAPAAMEMTSRAEVAAFQEKLRAAAAKVEVKAKTGAG